VKCVGDLLLLFRCDSIEEWNGEGAGSYGFGEGKVGCSRAGVRQPCRLQMDGGKVAAGGDAALGERFLDVFAICEEGKANDINKPADGAVGQGDGWEFEAGDGAQKTVIALGRGVAKGEDFADAGELNAAEGAGNVGEAVVVAGFGVVEPGFA